MSVAPETECHYCGKAMSEYRTMRLDPLKWLDSVSTGVSAEPKRIETEYRCEDATCLRVRAECLRERRELMSECERAVDDCRVERNEARNLVKSMFDQACGDFSDEHGVYFYDHQYLSAYEHAQEALLEWGLIEERQCLRGRIGDASA